MILSLAVQRGGTAKTTTAAALAQAAAHQGEKVLAIDLDPQGNLTYSLQADGNGRGSFDLLEGTPARRIIQQTSSGIDVIPSNWALSTIQSSTGSAKRLQRALEPVRNRYRLIVIDTPPTAGELQYNALQASTGLVIPLQADIFGLQGLYQIADTARQIQRTNPALEIIGIVFTRHNPRSTIARQMQDTITETAQGLNIPCLGAIREAVAVREAQALQRSLYEYAPNSKPAQDYLTLYQKIMEAKSDGK